jgi:hypothetical protein
MSTTEIITLKKLKNQKKKEQLLKDFRLGLILGK